MSLLTPPNSGKGAIAHTFAPADAASPSIDAPLFDSAAPYGYAPLVNHPSHTSRPAEHPQLYGRLNNGNRIPSVLATKRTQDVAPAPGHQSALHARRQPAQVGVSAGNGPTFDRAPHNNQERESQQVMSTYLQLTGNEQKAVQGLIDFADPDINVARYPQFRQHINHISNTWLDRPEGVYLTQEMITANTRETTTPPTKGRKRKSPPSRQSDPRKRIATSRASQTSITSAQPQAMTTTSHRRKRSTQSEPHQPKSENKATRKEASKPPVSLIPEDWYDFSQDVTSFDGELTPAEAMARVKDLPEPKDNKCMDGYVDRLLPIELEAAKRLSIPCQKYLVTKYGVFGGRLKHLLAAQDKRALTAGDQRQGLKSWNKTAAQSTSAIDVNKTSKLFDLVWKPLGWFEEKHFQKYLANPTAVVFPEFDGKGQLIQSGGFTA